MTIENGHAMVHLRADGIGNLLPLLAEYHKLHGLAPHVHHVVQHVVLHGHDTKAKHHFVSALDVCAELWEEHTGTDDAEVGSEEHGA